MSLVFCLGVGVRVGNSNSSVSPSKTWRNSRPRHKKPRRPWRMNRQSYKPQSRQRDGQNGDGEDTCWLPGALMRCGGKLRNTRPNGASLRITGIVESVHDPGWLMISLRVIQPILHLGFS